MGETTGTNKGSFISNFVKGLKAEFKKIIWPNQETVTKETVSVVVVTLILGAVIAVLDFIIKWGLSFII
jgi:preprotein translocase subunit SecE